MRLAALAAAALVSLTAAARAQPAPPQPVVYAPAYGYAPLPPPPLPAEDPVLAHRLSLGLEIGVTTIAGPHGNDQASFGGGLFTAGIRVTRHWELTGELGGGGGTDDTSRSVSLSLGLVGLRYHINPASPWCWFLDAGTGIGNITYLDEPYASPIEGGGPRLAGYLGGGVEHRTARIALSVEVRSVALSQGTIAADGAAAGEPAAIARTIDPQPTPTTPSDPSASRNGVQIFGSLSFFL